MMLQAMAEALKGQSKVIIDPSAGQPEIWLNMKEILGTTGLDFEKAQF